MTKYEFDNLIKPLVEIYDEIELDIIKDMLYAGKVETCGKKICQYTGVKVALFKRRRN